MANDVSIALFTVLERLAPRAYRGLLEVHAALEESTLGKRLVGLVFLRISQINDCAFCVDLHARELP